jgi:hypothetical protein
LLPSAERQHPAATPNNAAVALGDQADQEMPLPAEATSGPARNAGEVSPVDGQRKVL